jgi:phage baseplate assembly protein V
VEAVIRTINKVTAPLARRVNLMVARGVLVLVNDALKMQDVQVKLLSGATEDSTPEVRDMERFQDYGFTGNAHPGAEVAVVFVGGNRDHGLVFAVGDRRYRVKGLETGEVAMYDDLGHTVQLKRTGIVITGATHDINIIDCPKVIVTGGDVVADGVSLKLHHHNEHDGPPTGSAVA